LSKISYVEEKRKGKTVDKTKLSDQGYLAI